MAASFSHKLHKRIAELSPNGIDATQATRNAEEVLRVAGLLTKDGTLLDSVTATAIERDMRDDCRIVALVETGILATICNHLDATGRTRADMLDYAADALGEIAASLRDYQARLRAASERAERTHATPEMRVTVAA